MDAENKFPYCTMELLNSEYSIAMEHVWGHEDEEGWDFVEGCGKRAYYQGYADAMAKAVRVINHDFDKAGEGE